ncbi:MAG: ATP-dependent Clp protease ATP-binding subunit [Anaerolineales bacterium]|nr:ATP-dependent Clp protease ATP-binding subunit [Anaerolineales bacterium]
MSNMERFTQRARRVLSLAHEEAERMRHSHIGTEHLLLGLMLEDGGIAGRVLKELGLEFDRVRNIIERMVGLGEYNTRRPTLSPGTQQVLELAVEQARQLGHHYIGVEHLLLGIIELDEGIGLDALTQLGVTPEQVRRQTHRVLKETKSAQHERSQQRRQRAKETAGKGKFKSKTPLVDQLATDLTKMAEDGKLDPVIGRQMEIERVVQILARRRKNNPALTGDPGVGKTAIVEGLAQRILEGDVPIPLLGKRLLQLDVGSLVAGTMYRGQFEDRLKRVIQELKSSDSILFIDELHMLVGAGSAGSAMDAANILKPALSRGELHVIGATTLDEYRKHIESDAALERRFQPIFVEEPTPEETIEILRGIRPAYEAHHQLSILDEALESATNLSTRYVSDRFLPDKAIDLIDEAASRVRMYKSPVAQTTKDLMSALRDIRKQVQEAMDNKVGQAEIQGLQKQQGEFEAEFEHLRTTWDRETSPNVTSDDIAEIVAMWTGVPVMQMAQAESERLLHMEDELRELIVGQDEAIETISKAVRRGRAGLKDPRRPIGSFVFLGPTGVGKTELTKALAKFLFGDEEALIQLDMSEFMERHSVSRLVGAPPGYIGYDEAGQLTEAIRRKPYSIIVFDEIEKAHPDAHNMLLQIMEEGQLTDAKGRKVDFRNAIIVMTSNIGAREIQEKTVGFQLKRDEELDERLAYRDMHKGLIKKLKKEFRPEFVNRLDSVIVFRSLSKEDLKEIVGLELDKVAGRLVEQAITMDVTPEAVNLLADLGYDPDMGARPLRRVIQKNIEQPLSDAILAGKFKIGDTVLVDIEPTEDDEPEIVLLPVDRKDDSSEDEQEEMVAAA